MKTLVACVVLSFATTSCATLSGAGSAVLACGDAAVQSVINAPGGLIAQVSTILLSGAINWQSALDALLTDGGPAVVCAVQAVTASLEKGTAPAVAGSATAAPAAAAAISVGAIRGNAWLTAAGHYKLVK